MKEERIESKATLIRFRSLRAARGSVISEGRDIRRSTEYQKGKQKAAGSGETVHQSSPGEYQSKLSLAARSGQTAALPRVRCRQRELMYRRPIPFL